jgi:hypothetical protein
VRGAQRRSEGNGEAVERRVGCLRAGEAGVDEVEAVAEAGGGGGDVEAGSVIVQRRVAAPTLASRPNTLMRFSWF